MAVTATGFQGTVNDAAMAAMFPNEPPVAEGDGDLLVTTVGGARTVSIAAGSAKHLFVRVTNSAAVQLPLSPPASGGKWYLVVLRRQWSPTNVATFVAIDAGYLTDGTAQNAPPTYGAPSGMLWGVGTAAGADQALAWVHVRAADTTLNVFDLRLIRTGTGTPKALGLPAIHWCRDVLSDGATVSLAQFVSAGGSTHNKSLWMKVNGVMVAVGQIVATAGGSTPFRTDLLNFCLGRNSMGLWADHTEILESGVRWLFDGTSVNWTPQLGGMMVHSYWSSSTDQSTVPNGWTDVQFDSNVSDTSGIRIDGTRFVIPFTGRWSLWGRVATMNDDNAARYMLCWQDMGAGQDLAWRGQVGTFALTPFDVYTEQILTKGQVVKLRIFRASTGAVWLAHGATIQQLRPEAILRYLGKV